MDREIAAKIHDEFPILQEKVNNEPLVYLDSASTSQLPRFVSNNVNQFNQTLRANVHRSVDSLGIEATGKFENARRSIQKFINAKSYKEIIFTSGCTDSLNMVAATYGNQNVQKDDEIVLTIMEHHSNLIPWQQLAKAKSAKLKYIDLTSNGELDIEDAKKKITTKTKIVAITQVSNVLGVINPIKQIAKIAHSVGATVVVDGAQAVGHIKVDVQDLDADFYAFSGHKMFGPDGIGVLYGKKSILENMPPYRFGGEMIENVTKEDATWADLPQKFEAGTPNISGAVGLGAAVEFINNFGLNLVTEHEKELVSYSLPKLLQIPTLKIYGPEKSTKRTGVISFNLKGIHPHDVATALDLEGIEVRAGHHCAQPLMNELGIESCVRISFSIFNTYADCDKLLEALEQIKDFFENGSN